MIRKSLLTAGASLALLGALSGAAMAANSDRNFLRTAIKGDNSEMRLGKLAAEKGVSQAVRDFGQMLVTDHGKAKNNAVAVAQPMGVKPPTIMMPVAKAELAKLKGLSGAAFDKEFASYMVDDHKKDIADFEKEAAKGSGKVPELARMTLPDLRKHLETASKIVTM